MNKKSLTLLLILLCLTVTDLLAQSITRGPYLQSVYQDKISIRWRTSTATQSKVWYGSAPGNLLQTISLPVVVTEHEVFLTGLSPNTTYYYAVGDENGQKAGATADHYFKTSPMPDTPGNISIWVLGDAGRGNSNQRSVRDAFYLYNGDAPVDLILTLGDNAYSDGTDSEFQDSWFENMYEDRLINIPLFQTFGNHDGGSADGADGTGVYFDIFTMPSDGSCGGLASGMESYYSFDYGNVHIISLNTWDVPRSAASEMIAWLNADLAANDKNWTIVKFHHPVYDGANGIDSDSKSLNIEMRESCVPIFDQYGVDLVLMGHSHTYQRSYLIHGHYGKSNTFNPATMGINMGDGQLDGDGPYQQVDGKGTVYVIAGTAGSVSSTNSLDHPVMFHNALELGSFLINIDHDQLDAKFLTADGIVDDYFTITKDIEPVQLVSITNPLQGFSAPQTAIITTAIAESTNAITSVAFYINEELIGTDHSFPFTMDWTIPANGPYDIEILANGGSVNYTDSVRIVVGDQIYPSDSDGDGTLDEDDLCSGSLEPGTICNDNNSATYNDLITTNCTCEGTPYDCPVLMTDIGTPCDDNNPTTYDDIVNGNCDCAGIPYDCPTHLSDFGTPCNDNNPNTIDDMLNNNCDCVGIPVTNVVTNTIKLLENSDDAEEAADGNMSLNSTDLEMVQESTQQIIGLRYALANIPPDAYILEAHLQFTVDEINADPTTLYIRGEMAANAPTFNNSNGNISTRLKTQSFVSWDVGPWLTIAEENAPQRSPDLSPVIQEIMSQSDYTASTPIVFIVEGQGKRVASSHDKANSDGPALIITYGFNCPDTDGDGICDQDDLCPNNPGSVGDPCNDGDPATNNDVYNGNCICEGTSSAFDCPTLLANIGSPCNDNNNATTNDVVTTNCTCEGSAIAANITVTTQVNNSSDDAEEKANGNVSLSSTDLELVQEQTTQVVGIRFANPGIPASANIVTAYIQFTVDEMVNQNPINLNIFGQASGNPSTFVNTANNISSRSKTNTVVFWQPENWSTAGAQSATQQTSDISLIVQELVNQPDYQIGNALAFIIEGTGKRVAKSYDGSTQYAPKLVVTYATGPVVYDCPVLQLNIDDSCNDNNSATINDVVNGNCNCEGEPLPLYDCPVLQLNIGDSCNDNNTATINDVVNTNCTCEGEFIINYDCPQLELNFGDVCDDGDPETINDLVLTDCSCAGNIPTGYACARISASHDDAEEKSNGAINLSSSDLELVSSSSDQVIGMRFQNLNIPEGAVISSANIQFTVDETENVNPCNLLIYGELNPNPLPFSNDNSNISSRTKTDTYLSWIPEEWLQVNVSGPDQQTIDIAPILQEVVNQPGYNISSAIVIIIEGTGARIAESYDGSQQGAPELCVAYDLSTITSANVKSTITTAEQEQTVSFIPENAKLQVYPNPTKDYLILRFDPHQIDRDATIQIWDINGRLVHNEKQMIIAGQEEVRIKGFDLPNGTYTVQLHREPYLKSAKFVVYK